MDLMKKIFSVLLLVFSLSLYPQKSSKPIEVEEFVLDNGLTIMLSENNESPNIFGAARWALSPLTALRALGHARWRVPGPGTSTCRAHPTTWRLHYAVCVHADHRRTRRQLGWDPISPRRRPPRPR